MRGIIRLLVALLILTGNTASANDLSTQLNQFFTARYRQNEQHTSHLRVVVKTPQTMWPECATPQFSLPGNSRMLGNISVAANCGQNRRYIQVQVQMNGNYLVVVRLVTRGTVITAADLKLEKGRLDNLPTRTLFDPQQAVGAIALRDLIPGQPITLMMMRPPWRVKAGQMVTVTTNGEGFNISNKGRAMNNATVAQSVRVRMNSGQIVSGKVRRDGNIFISL